MADTAETTWRMWTDDSSGKITLTDNNTVFNDPYTFDGGISFDKQDVTWLPTLNAQEVITLRALIKLLVDTDLFRTLTEEVGIDADAAIATAFKGKLEVGEKQDG